MDSSTLAFWRDWAVILLVLEMFVIALVPGVVIFFALKGLRALKRWIRLPLLNAQVWSMRIQLGTTRTMNAVAAVPIGIAERYTWVSTTTRGVVNFILGR